MTTSANKGALNVAVWIVQVLLAVGFGMAGVMKSTAPIADLSAKMPWVSAVPEALVRFIGVSELVGAVGLILPAATRIRPGLTALAAAGLVVVMVLALGFHATRGELAQAAPVNVVLGGLAAFVAWGRFKKLPIAPGT
jgi:putative oxidoreductase